jgi:recombination protein RecA
MATKKKKSQERSTQKGTQKKSAQDKRKDEVANIKISQSSNIDQIREMLNKQFSAEIATEIKEKPAIVLSTGILSMDLAINHGGLLGGRVMDIHGWEGTGKTLICMTIGGYIQRCTKLNEKGEIVNRKVAFCDAEGTFSPAFAASAGINNDELILIQSTPDRILSGEDYFDIIIILLREGIDYIIVDSCPALVPRQVLLTETGQGQKATDAQLMSQGLKKITPIVSSTGRSLVHFVNQKRSKPMAMAWERNETETGGNALKFFSSYRFDVVNVDDIEKSVLGADGQFRKKKVGVNSCVKMIKSKVAPIPPFLPSKNYHFDFDVYFEDFKDDEGLEYNRGVDVVKDYVETGLRCEVITQSSSWFYYGDLKTNGKTEMIRQLRANPEIMSQIRDDVFTKMKVAIPTLA